MTLRRSARTPAEQAHLTAGVGPRRRTRLALVSTLAALGLFVFTAPSALATTEFHAFSTSFAGSGANALSEPTGVAVDQSTGDVYVADTTDNRVEKFSPAGEFILMFGKEVNKTKAEQFHETGNPHRITEAEENLCAEASPGECQPGKGVNSPGGSHQPTMLAVDNSPGGEGDVYVANKGGSEQISKFNSSGNLIATWGTRGQRVTEEPLSGIAVDPTGSLFDIADDSIPLADWYEQDGVLHSKFRFPPGVARTGLAVDAEDHFYRIDTVSGVVKFTDTGESLGEPDGREDSIGLAVDPSTNDLYVIQGGEGGFVNHYALDCTQSPNCTPLDSFGQGHLSSPRAIAVDGESGAVYVTDPAGPRVDLFTPVPGAALTAAKAGAGSGTLTSSPAGIGCGPACPEQTTEFAKASSLTLTATPTERSTFAGWTGCEEELSPTECKLTIGTVKEIKAEFIPIPQKKLTVANPGTGLGAGTVTATSPGPEFTPIDCGNGATTCAETYNEAAQITLFATPNEHSSFVGWGAGDCEAENGTECTLTMSEARSVQAEFSSLPQQKLTITNTEGTGAGTVTGTSPGPESTPIDCVEGTGVCEASYNEGSTIILFAAPAQGSVFLEWTGCTNPIGPTECEVVMSEANSVKANFAALPQATVNPPSSLTATAATLSANLNPTGGEVTACRFEYTTGPEFATGRWNGVNGHAECSPSRPYNASTALSAVAAPLSSGTHYHDRVLLTNEHGTSEAEGEFTTLSHYRFSTDFGSPGSGDGQLQDPQGVALDNSTGDLYVADTGNHRVEQLSSAGAFIRAFGADVGGAGVDICTAGCAAGTPGSAPGQFTSPTYIAVDNSTGPSVGDVYVADTADNLVQKFDSEGHLITAWEDGGTKEYPAGIAGIAVRSDGQLIVQPGSGSGIALDANGTVYPGPVAIDPATNFLYTDIGPEIERSTARPYCNSYGQECSVPPECNSAGAEDCPLAEFFGAGHLSAAAALAFDPSSEAIYAANSGDGDIAVFTPLPLPTLTTGPVEAPTATTATLTGVVQPVGGEEATACHFEYIREAPFVNEVQTLTLSGATGGFFNLGFRGKTTGATGEGELTEGSNEVTGVHTTTGAFAVGQSIVGPGIGAATTIAAVGSGTLTLSAPAEASAAAVALSAGIPFDASAAEVQSALEALSTIGPANLSVTGSSGGPYSVEFTGTRADADVPQLTAESSSLTPPAATVTPATTTEGFGLSSAVSVPCLPAANLASSTAVSAEITGLLPFATYKYRLISTDAAAQGLFRYGHYRTFIAAPSQTPEIDATSSSAVAPTTATLHAEINPNDAPTVYRFRYGTTAAYGSQTALSESIGEDATDHSVSTEITGLAPATTYHFQAVAINLNGVTEGPDQTLTTPAPPAVGETAASAIGPTTATLGALIRPGFRSTTYHFEYGAGTAYGHATTQSPLIGSDNSSHPATATLTGLTPNTTYHFRIFATNEIGTTPGPDQTFTTAAEEVKKVVPPPTCKKGFVKKHGKCVKKPKPHHKRKHHKRGGHR